MFDKIDINRFPLFLYGVSFFLTVVGILFDLEMLVFFSKPIIVPSLLFYYFQKNKDVDWFFLLAILLNFISDIYIAIGGKNEIVITALIIVVKVILITYLINDFFQKWNLIKYKILQLFLIISISVVVFYFILDFFKNVDTTIFYLYFLNGILLMIIGVVSLFLNLFSPNNRTYYALIMSICLILADVFYSFYVLDYNILSFTVIYNASQMISYYFMLNFVTATDNQNYEIGTK